MKKIHLFNYEHETLTDNETDILKSSCVDKEENQKQIITEKMVRIIIREIKFIWLIC